MVTSTYEAGLSPALITEIASQSGRRVAGDFYTLTDEMRVLFGDSLLAVILYGSCMTTQNTKDGIVDLYVIVDKYSNAYHKRYLRILNQWLPPNVFYLEAGSGEDSVRIKYTVISLEDLQYGVTSWFHSYIWSRLAQPVRILHARDEAVRHTIHTVLAGAVLRFLRTSIPVLNQLTVDAQTIWTNGLTLTYQSELRPERDGRAGHLTQQNLGDFIRLTECAAPELEMVKPLPQSYYQCLTGRQGQRRALRLWRIRRWQGRLLSVLRLAKAGFTFRNCADYAVWKIERHTGVTITLTPRQQRHPVFFGVSVLWQLMRRGIIH